MGSLNFSKPAVSAMSRSSRLNWLRLIWLMSLAFQFIVLEGKTARAEGFVEKPFEAQWQETDAAVLSGTKRTFFWGPEPFAHAYEGYAEASNNGQRRVQYFDKARMELTK